MRGFRRARLGLVALALALGCGKRETGAGGPPALSASADRNADGKALERVRADWRPRWQREPPPPSCESLLAKPEERALCSAAARALAVLQAQVEKGAPAVEALAGARELALAASHAETKLRFAGMQYLASQGAAPGGAASASGKRSAGPPPPALSGRAALAAASSAGSFGGAARHDNPFLPLVRGYGKLATQAIRFIGAFAEYGPVPVRAAAVSELERLHADHEPWHALAQVARQSFLLERDPALKARLDRLDRLAAKAPARPAP